MPMPTARMSQTFRAPGDIAGAAVGARGGAGAGRVGGVAPPPSDRRSQGRRGTVTSSSSSGMPAATTREQEVIPEPRYDVLQVRSFDPFVDHPPFGSRWSMESRLRGGGVGGGSAGRDSDVYTHGRDPASHRDLVEATLELIQQRTREGRDFAQGNHGRWQQSAHTTAVGPGPGPGRGSRRLHASSATLQADTAATAVATADGAPAADTTSSAQRAAPSDWRAQRASQSVTAPTAAISAGDRLEEHARRRKHRQLLASEAIDRAELAELDTLREVPSGTRRSKPSVRSSTEDWDTRDGALFFRE